VKAGAKTEAEVRATLDRYIEACARRDVDSVMELFGPDPDLVGLGSGSDEIAMGPSALRARFERDFSQSEAISINWQWMSVSASGPVAWVAGECHIGFSAGGREGSGGYRFTAVLERRGGRWLLMQTHLSAPASEQPEGQSWPTPVEALALAVGAERPDLRAQTAPDGTVTMLFTDIENSTAMTERLGDARWLELLSAHNAIVREQAEAHGCFEVKSQGDAYQRETWPL
jgi:ketosteroid isomerase-like protein